MIDPMDVRRTVSGVNAWLDTIGAPQAQVDEIIEKLIDARGNWNKTQAVAVDMQDAFQARLVSLGQMHFAHCIETMQSYPDNRLDILAKHDYQP